MVASIILMVLSPLFLVIAILLRITAEGKVFYLQKRIGLHNRYFKIWKFATMLENSPNMGTGMITVRNDPRVTVMGRLLRKTKINELPQVINVLKGEMSIVGPRPLADKTFNAYSNEVKKEIYNVKPGITSLGSVVFRDEEKLLSVTPLPPQDYYRQYIAPYKGELELWYQKRASFKNDLLIIFLTAWEIFFPDSDLAFKVFKDLPKRPVEVTVEGAKGVGMELAAE